jgi:hypothetical protein
MLFLTDQKRIEGRVEIVIGYLKLSESLIQTHWIQGQDPSVNLLEIRLESLKLLDQAISPSPILLHIRRIGKEDLQFSRHLGKVFVQRLHQASTGKIERKHH